MIWLVYRRQRSAFRIALGLVLVAAVAVTIGRLVYLAEARDLGLVGCIDKGLSGCEGDGWSRFVQSFQGYWGLSRSFLLLMPTVVGVLAGAGLFGREFDQGTHVFALTQSIGRLRWWSIGVVTAGLPAVVAVGLLTLVTRWAFAPFAGMLPLEALVPPVFETSGVAPMAYTALAFTLASAAGLVLRSTPGAIATALLITLVTQYSFGLFLRRNYATPSEATTPVADGPYGQLQQPDVPPGSWYVSSGYLDPQGHVVSSGAAATCPSAECLRTSGVSQVFTLYHGPERFWPFQLDESFMVLGLATAALVAGYAGLRRHLR